VIFCAIIARLFSKWVFTQLNWLGAGFGFFGWLGLWFGFWFRLTFFYLGHLLSGQRKIPLARDLLGNNLLGFNAPSQPR